MISPEQFYSLLKDKGVSFFTGVPDSLLRDFLLLLQEKESVSSHVIAANEGGAIALASGYHLATDQVPLVYLQNSGLGNTVNPLTSLTSQSAYSIPIVMLIGWRGEPGLHDEPQHVQQGAITLELLQLLGIQYEVIRPQTSIDKTAVLVERVLHEARRSKSPTALVVCKNTFEERPGEVKKTFENNSISRELALETLVKSIDKDTIVVSSTGKVSRELYEIREMRGMDHSQDFLTIGSMGHASQIALSIALQKPTRSVLCIDGDGSMLMHLGALPVIGSLNPNNFKHIVINNGAHESVGGQPTAASDICLADVAKASGYSYTERVESLTNLDNALHKLLTQEGSSMLEVSVNTESRKDLMRPSTPPQDSKISFMRFINRS